MTAEKENIRVHYCPCPGETPYACAVWDEDACGRLNIICRFLPGTEFRFGHSRMISDHIGMEIFFLRKDCLMLHAAFIRWRGRESFSQLRPEQESLHRLSSGKSMKGRIS